ncbi:hypothetical protein [uncultured Clostridium sp.]|uniref:hypothetical protein n=1 Tax=uncultured Clostridium sp. TaxID=59620 RepID=UPI00262FAFDB|nr:hypothetical protein [uncultured Clostridium sp.]
MSIYKNQQITMEAIMLLPKMSIYLPTYYMIPFTADNGLNVFYNNGLAITVFKIYKTNNSSLLKCDMFNGFWDLSDRSDKINFKDTLYKGELPFIEVKRTIELQLENLIIFEMGSRKADKDFTNLLASNIRLLKESISDYYSIAKRDCIY